MSLMLRSLLLAPLPTFLVPINSEQERVCCFHTTSTPAWFVAPTVSQHTVLTDAVLCTWVYPFSSFGIFIFILWVFFLHDIISSLQITTQCCLNFVSLATVKPFTEELEKLCGIQASVDYPRGQACVEFSKLRSPSAVLIVFHEVVWYCQCSAYFLLLFNKQIVLSQAASTQGQRQQKFVLSQL